MSKVYVAKLNENLKRSIANHELSDEEIGKVYESLKAHMKKNKSMLTFIMIFFGILLLGMGGYAVYDIGDTDALKIFIPVVVVVFAVVWLVSWFCTIGKVSKEWNRKLKEYYPTISEQYKL